MIFDIFIASYFYLCYLIIYIIVFYLEEFKKIMLSTLYFRYFASLNKMMRDGQSSSLTIIVKGLN
jgi:hypothetical protein